MQQQAVYNNNTGHIFVIATCTAIAMVLVHVI